MKTITAYVGRINGKTLKFSNKYPDNCQEVRKSYWCEDWKSTPNPAEAVPASYEDVESRCELEGIREVVINRCK